MADVELTENAIAFKEWSVICAALAAGRQTIILRKGGIHEGREGFRVSHREFWLLPTHFHASADALVNDAKDLFSAAETLQREKAFCLRHYVVVQDVIELAREDDALALAGLHLWSEATVRQRFHYKQPGLFCLIVRALNATSATWIEDTPAIAGCRSWVELPMALPAGTLVPALDDGAFQAMAAKVQSHLRASR